MSSTELVAQVADVIRRAQVQVLWHPGRAARLNERELELSLLAYETHVRFADVSGMEHLDMLIGRSKLEQHRPEMSADQLMRLAAADQQLLAQCDAFYTAIREIADLSAWREKVGASADQWWWYLDVLSHAHTGVLPALAPIS